MTTTEPLVSIICLSHNHESFIEEAISSVEQQTYSNLEVILVDDGSTDHSKAIMRKIAEERGYFYIDIEESIGNCAAFNKGFFASKGAYIIDLAADDVLCPDRVLRGVTPFENKKVGVHFCDAEFIDNNGNHLGYHYRRNTAGELLSQVPSGDIYLNLIQHYFICPPSMMIRRQVLEQMGGYDETLSFEDFDLWIRSSRNWLYEFTDEVLVKKRILGTSLSQQQTTFRNRHQRTVLAVCKKIKDLNQSDTESQALRRRCNYEIKRCLLQGNLELVPAFIRLGYFP